MASAIPAHSPQPATEPQAEQHDGRADVEAPPDQHRLQHLPFERRQQQVRARHPDGLADAIERHQRHDREQQERRRRAGVGDEVEHERDQPPEQRVGHVEPVHRDRGADAQHEIAHGHGAEVTTEFAPHAQEDRAGAAPGRAGRTVATERGEVHREQEQRQEQHADDRDDPFLRALDEAFRLQRNRRGFLVTPRVGRRHALGLCRDRLDLGDEPDERTQLALELAEGRGRRVEPCSCGFPGHAEQRAHDRQQHRHYERCRGDARYRDDAPAVPRPATGSGPGNSRTGPARRPIART